MDLAAAYQHSDCSINSNESSIERDKNSHTRVAISTGKKDGILDDADPEFSAAVLDRRA
jgi:hypothetical protein